MEQGLTTKRTKVATELGNTGVPKGAPGERLAGWIWEGRMGA